MSDLPSNAKRAKQPTEKAPRTVQGANPLESPAGKSKEAPKQIVTGEVKPVKESVFKKFKNNFFGSDVNSVMGYITKEVLLPAVRDLIVDTTSKGIEQMIYGEVRSTRRRTSTDGRPRYSYSNPIDVRPSSSYTRGRVPPRVPVRQTGRRHMVGEILLVSKADADRVLETMSELIDRYDAVSVADLYSLLGHPTNYIDNNWGWTELVFANVLQTQDGWMLDLPPVQPLR